MAASRSRVSQVEPGVKTKKKHKWSRKKDWRTDVDEMGNVVILRQGVWKSLSGDEYEGEFLEGKKHGRGRMNFINGNTYEGDWQHDAFHGYGVMKYAEFTEGARRIVGRMYKGYWFKGEMQGYGIFTKGDGETYEGEFRHNRYHGRGRLRLRDGSQYDGHLKQGQYHGKGLLRFEDGSSYKGGFRAGHFHGHGVFSWPKGGGSYAGSFAKGKRDGFGKRVFANGNTYEGEYFEGCMHGKGRYTTVAGDLFVGEFLNDRFHGFGVMQYGNGDRYEGQWQKGNPCGRGRYDYEAGGYYEGEYWALCRTGIKAALDEADLAQFAHPDSITRKMAEKGSKPLTKGFLKQIHEAKQQDKARGVPSGVKGNLPAHQRRKLYDKRRQVGTILVGSEYDDPQRGGVMRPVADGKRHGRGIRVWSSGARYEGQWWQGEPHGFGVYVGPGVMGERYEGQMKFGVREGRGIASYGHNEGGRYIDPLGFSLDGGLGRSVYDGEWHAGLFHGSGKFTAPDGRMYTGEFRYGKREGIGSAVMIGSEDLKYIKEAGRSDALYKAYKYDGQFENNRRNGRGVLELLNGDRLAGLFKQDLLDGLVKCIYASSGTVRYAMYRAGKRMSWLEGRKLQEALAKDAAMGVAADVFKGVAVGTDVLRAAHKARADVKEESKETKRFDIRAVHVNFADEAGALERRRAAREANAGASVPGPSSRQETAPEELD